MMSIARLAINSTELTTATAPNDPPKRAIIWSIDADAALSHRFFQKFIAAFQSRRSFAVGL